MSRNDFEQFKLEFNRYIPVYHIDEPKLVLRLTNLNLNEQSNNFAQLTLECVKLDTPSREYSIQLNNTNPTSQAKHLAHSIMIEHGVKHELQPSGNITVDVFKAANDIAAITRRGVGNVVFLPSSIVCDLSPQARSLFTVSESPNNQILVAFISPQSIDAGIVASLIYNETNNEVNVIIFSDDDSKNYYRYWSIKE